MSGSTAWTLIIVALAVLAVGCQTVKDALLPEGQVVEVTDVDGDGAPDSVTNLVTGEVTPIPDLENPAELRIVLEKLLEKQKRAAFDALKQTEWGRQLQSLAANAAALLSAAVGIYYGLRKRKQARTTAVQLGDEQRVTRVIVNALDRVRKSSPTVAEEFKTAMTETIKATGTDETLVRTVVAKHKG